MRLTVVLLLLACPFVASLGCDLQNLALGRVKGPSNTNLQTGAHQVSVWCHFGFALNGIFSYLKSRPARHLISLPALNDIFR